MPTFVQFRTANNHLKNSDTYTSCQRLLLEQERENKKRKQVEDSAKLNSIKNELRETLSSMDYLFVTSLFLDKNRKNHQKIEATQNKKLSKMMKDPLSLSGYSLNHFKTSAVFLHWW